MKIEELIMQLQLKGFTGIQVTGIDERGRTYSIKEVETEFHPDATSVATVWLKLDEN